MLLLPINPYSKLFPNWLSPSIYENVYWYSFSKFLLTSCKSFRWIRYTITVLRHSSKFEMVWRKASSLIHKPIADIASENSTQTFSYVFRVEMEYVNVNFLLIESNCNTCFNTCINRKYFKGNRWLFKYFLILKHNYSVTQNWQKPNVLILWHDNFAVYFFLIYYEGLWGNKKNRQIHK